jgi:hypothetical protein
MTAVVFGVGLRYRIFAVSLTDVRFLICVNAALHFVLMAEAYRDEVDMPSDSLYLTMTGLCYLGLMLGFLVANWLAKKYGLDARPKPAPPAGKWLTFFILTILAICIGVHLVNYAQEMGTLNPFAGIIHYFTSGNLANEMWNTEGAETFGASRGSDLLANGGLVETFMHIVSRMHPLLLLLIGFLARRYRFWAIIGLTGSEMLEMTSGYFARTSVLLTLGLIVLYIDENIRRFKRREFFGILVAAFATFMILHMARLGVAGSVDELVGEGSFEEYKSAVVGTFGPISWAIKYHDSVGENDWAKNLAYIKSYFGVIIPRPLWHNKPVYALEPDMTMDLTGEDIDGNNPVQTFAIVGEGFMLWDLPGVFLISFLFALLTAFVCAALATREELNIVRYFIILFATYSFRLSLFTFYAVGLTLGLVPALIVYVFLRLAFVGSEKKDERGSVQSPSSPSASIERKLG